jgi:hypothetical protein
MIISDAHRLTFVHIPKCAGVSVKQPLRAIDSTGGYFSRIGDHPVLGRVHFAHLTLRDLADHFPDEWVKLRTYRAFAVVRDPGERFISAMFQRLREFKGLNQSDITPARIEAEADEVIRYLERTPDRLDLEHVHFNRQTDYLDLDGVRLVDDLFAIEDMARLVAYVAAHTGIAVEEERQNRSTELRSGRMKPLVRALKTPYFALVPYPVRNALRARMERAGLYGAVAKQQMIVPGGRLAGFISVYYADDLRLHAAARA